MKKVASLAFLLCLSANVPAAACETCFGNPNDPQTQGMQAAILALLIITYATLLSIVAFFVYLAVRSRKYRQQANLET